MARTKVFRECGPTNNALAYKVCDRTGRKQTNADKIRAMNDEELAEFISIAFNFCCNPSDKCLEAIFNKGECEKTVECVLKWLQSEVEDNDD